MKKYDKAMMETAEIWSQQSYCERLKVGAILSKDGRILITGYNGTISKTKNSCEDVVYKCKMCGFESSQEFKKCLNCSVEYVAKILTTSEFVLHAEQNVITFSAKNGIPTKDCTLYVTHSPCKQCSKIIAQSGIIRVVYKNEYRDKEGINFLNSVGVEVVKY